MGMVAAIIQAVTPRQRVFQGVWHGPMRALRRLTEREYESDDEHGNLGISSPSQLAPCLPVCRRGLPNTMPNRPAIPAQVWRPDTGSLLLQVAYNCQNGVRWEGSDIH